jgi:hypothetical protein
MARFFESYRRTTSVKIMASIKFDNFLVDIAVYNIDGFLQEVFSIPTKNGFWVFLTVQNDQGKKEYFPSVDDESKIKIYGSYDEAIEDVAHILKKHFR